MKLHGWVWILGLIWLTGCASLLEREYSVVEPHSSKFWESEAADTLRAENAQDLVNDLLILIGQHKESAVVRLYDLGGDLSASEMVEQAAMEVQQETPLGAYAVEYITSSVQPQRGYYEVSVRIGYRRSAEQLQGIVTATSPEAVYSLLESALDTGQAELAVRISYWGADGQETVDSAVERLREERGLTESPAWTITRYPADGTVGLVEFLLEDAESVPDDALRENETPEKEPNQQ